MPQIELLRQEYVLVQAWKKTAAHIRYHNWYADTLEIDLAAVNLPDFLRDIAAKLSSPHSWNNDPLRIVPAPKSQPWKVSMGRWEPVGGTKATAKKIRPLAHVALKDQVAATALMLCLADRVETLQGDPRRAIRTARERVRVISYGNRLFCDNVNDGLRHRWGSAKLYRAYFQDYQTFLSRPEVVAEALSTDQSTKIVIVHSDLKQFYDRVRPEFLTRKLFALTESHDDPSFFEFSKRLLNWRWHNNDADEVSHYANEGQLTDFSHIALPQGLVAAGFFANIALLDFDQELRNLLNTEILEGITLHDACRYVDDIRLVLTVSRELSLEELEYGIAGWLQQVLDGQTDGLIVSKEKTKAAHFRGDERPLVRQSRKMKRIQKAISGGFDAIGGQEILDAVQGLVRSQARYSKDRTSDTGWLLAPIPDVRDNTVARFAAARFRTTFRSLRPLLEVRETTRGVNQENLTEENFHLRRTARTQQELDDESRAFALGLVENWVEDPSNVRLLRIGLDIWPDAEVLKRVLDLLHQYTETGGGKKAPRRVAWYCLGEIFRAGATETGFVEDSELLPKGVNIDAYRSTLLEEAIHLASLPSQTLPWYLKQQILLFLSGCGPEKARIFRKGKNPETKHYRDLLFFLRGEPRNMRDADFATLAILSRRSFLDRERSLKIIAEQLTPNRIRHIAERDPSFGLEILNEHPYLVKELPIRIRHDLCLSQHAVSHDSLSLARHVLSEDEDLRNEPCLLEFASKLIKMLGADEVPEVITPLDVQIGSDETAGRSVSIQDINLINSGISPSGSIYRPPTWCPPEERWRFQIGYLLRFVLTKRQDFTKPVRRQNWREGTVLYRIPESHWAQRMYGLYSGHSAFGADWLPITDWTEHLLFALLRWPGCKPSHLWECVGSGIAQTLQKIGERIERLKSLAGKTSGTLILPISAPWPDKPSGTRPLRMCVVQTVIPNTDCFKVSDLTLSNTVARRCHRNHLSAALSAVERMLDLRETHKGQDGRLDLLVLPELAVHPSDVRTHLEPFVRAHRTIVVTGIVYEELFSQKPLINSALWLIPKWSAQEGLQIIRRRQGKCNLAPMEQHFNSIKTVVQGFRPCQWIVGYEWDSKQSAENPLRITASICYDATDIRLAADLRERSDIFIVPALNQDVKTFDQMALALHYHMFQMVVVANNGKFGGSNAYVPYKNEYERQVFHMHGQPQATMGFLEIEDIREFQRRNNPQGETEKKKWKHSPAGTAEQ